jgi:hypothetical protein
VPGREHEVLIGRHETELVSHAELHEQRVDRAELHAGPAASVPDLGEAKPVYGFQPFPSNGKVVTNDVIDELRDREGT